MSYVPDLTAVQRAPSLRNATSWRESPVLFASMQQLARDGIFPGPGAVPIRKGGRVVGAISTAAAWVRGPRSPVSMRVSSWQMGSQRTPRT